MSTSIVKVEGDVAKAEGDIAFGHLVVEQPSRQSHTLGSTVILTRKTESTFEHAGGRATVHENCKVQDRLSFRFKIAVSLIFCLTSFSTILFRL